MFRFLRLLPAPRATLGAALFGVCSTLAPGVPARAGLIHFKRGASHVENSIRIEGDAASYWTAPYSTSTIHIPMTVVDSSNWGPEFRGICAIVRDVSGVPTPSLEVAMSNRELRVRSIDALGSVATIQFDYLQALSLTDASALDNQRVLISVVVGGPINLRALMIVPESVSAVRVVADDGPPGHVVPPGEHVLIGGSGDPGQSGALASLDGIAGGMVVARRFALTDEEVLELFDVNDLGAFVEGANGLLRGRLAWGTSLAMIVRNHPGLSLAPGSEDTLSVFDVTASAFDRLLAFPGEPRVSFGPRTSGVHVRPSDFGWGVSPALVLEPPNEIPLPVEAPLLRRFAEGVIDRPFRCIVSANSRGDSLGGDAGQTALGDAFFQGAEELTEPDDYAQTLRPEIRWEYAAGLFSAAPQRIVGYGASLHVGISNHSPFLGYAYPNQTTGNRLAHRIRTDTGNTGGRQLARDVTRLTLRDAVMLEPDMSGGAAVPFFDVIMSNMGAIRPLDAKTISLYLLKGPGQGRVEIVRANRTGRFAGQVDLDPAGPVNTANLDTTTLESVCIAYTEDPPTLIATGDLLALAGAPIGGLGVQTQAPGSSVSGFGVVVSSTYNAASNETTLTLERMIGHDGVTPMPGDAIKLGPWDIVELCVHFPTELFGKGKGQIGNNWPLARLQNLSPESPVFLLYQVVEGSRPGMIPMSVGRAGTDYKVWPEFSFMTPSTLSGRPALETFIERLAPEAWIMRPAQNAATINGVTAPQAEWVVDLVRRAAPDSELIYITDAEHAFFDELDPISDTIYHNTLREICDRRGVGYASVQSASGTYATQLLYGRRRDSQHFTSSGVHDDGVLVLNALLEATLPLPGCSPADLASPYDSLDFSDVIAFLSAAAAESPVADLAPPEGVFDFSDVIAFLTAFGAGCP